MHSFSQQGKGKGNIDDAAEVRADGDEDNTETDGISTETTEETGSGKGKGKKKGSEEIDGEAAADDENETMLVRAEIEGDMSVPCSGKGCPKSPKSDDETTDDIEARADADESIEEIVSIESCKGKHCKQNSTAIEEDYAEEEKPCKGRKCDKAEETTDDIEARADADEPTEEIVSIKSCKGKHCKQNTTSVEETEEEKPCKGKKCKDDEPEDAEVRAEGATDTPVIAEVKVKKCKGKKCEEDVQEIANLAEAGVAEAAAVATEEPSKVSRISKMSSDETEVSTIVCCLHHLLHCN